MSQRHGSLLWMTVFIAWTTAANGQGQQAPAQAGQPASVQTGGEPIGALSIAGAAAIREDIGYLAQLANQPNLVPLFDQIVLQSTGNKGLSALDFTRPVVITAQTDGMQFWPLFFIPIRDEKSFVDLSKATAPKQKKLGNGIYRVNTDSGAEVFLRVAGNSAVGADSEDQLFRPMPNLPATMTMIPTGYDAAAAVDFQRLPATLRQLLSFMVQSYEQTSLLRPEGVSDIEWQMSTLHTRGLSQVLQMAIRDSRGATAGLRISPADHGAVLEAGIYAKEGTELDRTFANFGAETSRFNSLPTRRSALNAFVCAPIPTAGQSMLRNLLAQIKANAEASIAEQPETARPNLQAAVDRLADVFATNIDAGRLDAAAALFGEGRLPHTLVVAMHFIRANEAKTLFEEAARTANDQEVALNVLNYRGVAIHSFRPGFADGAARLFGPKSDVLIAFGNEALIVAVGGNNQAAIQSAIDITLSSQPARRAAPIRIEADVSRLTYVTELAEGFLPPDIQTMRQILGDREGDVWRISFVPAQRSIHGRFEIGDGFLRFLAINIAQSAGIAQ